MRFVSKRRKREIFASWVGILLMGVAGLYGVWVVYRDPDMTMQRIMLTSWPELLAVAFVFVLGYVMADYYGGEF